MKFFRRKKIKINIESIFFCEVFSNKYLFNLIFLESMSGRNGVFFVATGNSPT